MNCIHCGQTLNPGSKFCVSCGREQVDRTFPKPPEPPLHSASPPPYAPSSQPYSGPMSPSGTPNIPVPGKGGSAKIIVALAAVLLLLLGVGGAVAYFYFFPPGVFVRDSFRDLHPQLESDVQGMGNKVKFANKTLQILPQTKHFNVLLYDAVVSDNATIEGTVEWIEGDQDVLLGIVCCAANADNFQVLMIGGNNTYLLQGYAKGEWYDLTGFLKLPKTKEIRRNVPYKLTIKTEDDYISAFLDDEPLARMVDAVDHKGRVGIYAQGGTNGTSVIAFHSFRAKKNSMFQSD